MAKDLGEQLNRIGHKAELLVTRYSTLKDDNAALVAKLDALRAELEAQSRLIEKLTLELEHLKLSAALAPDTAAARRARDTLSELVRGIDACVNDLMKEV